MTFVSYSLRFFVLCVFVRKHTLGDPVLTAIPAESILNGEVTLRCQFESVVNGVVFTFPGAKTCVLESCKEPTCSKNFSCPENKTFEITMNVNASWNKETFFCQIAFGGVKSNLLTMTVKAPVTSLSLSPDLITVNASEKINLTCITGPCNPEATIRWFKRGIDITSKSNIETKSASGLNSFFRTTSILQYTGEKEDNHAGVYCEAMNQIGPGVKSAVYTLNVKFPPPSPPQITASPSGFQYDNGTNVILTCQQIGGNPLSTLSWNCKSSEMSSKNMTNSSTAVSVLEFTIDISYNKQKCTCTANHILSQQSKASEYLIVFLAVTKVTLNESQKSVNVNEHMNLTCVSSFCNPQANVTWYKGEVEINSDKIYSFTRESNGLYETTSTLQYTGVVEDNAKPVYCKASNFRNKLVNSAEFELDVRYPPSGDLSISSSSHSFVYTTGDSVNLTCTVSGGNPIANLSWVCGSNNPTTVTISNSSLAASVLRLKVDKAFNNKDCTCTASHPLQNKNKTVKLIVHYESKITTPLKKIYKINETEDFSLECTVDGNPLSNITWTFLKKNTVVNNTYNSNNCFFKIPSAKCSDHGEYQLVAENGIGRSVNTTNIAVNCKPRLFTADSQTQDEIGIGNNESLLISVQLLLYPPSRDFEWEFTGNNNQSNLIRNNSFGYKIASFISDNEQNITLYKQNVSDKEFGSYDLTIANSVGTFTKTYKVDGARSPLPPFNLTVVCDNPFSITWNAGFNGGDKQTFHIFSSSGENKAFKELTAVHDKGLGEIHSYSPAENLYGQFLFRISASNKFGNSTTDAIPCFFKTPDESPSNIAMLTGIAVGSGVCLAFVVIVVVYFRKYHKYEKSAKHIERLNNVNENEEDGADEDGLKENDLYVSAGPRDDEKPEVAVYAAVAKKLPQSDTNSNLYADVKKSGRQETNKGTMSSEVKPKKGLFKKDEKAKHKKGKKPKIRPGEADVYENSEDIAMSTNVDNVYSNAAQKGQNKQKERGYKNKDGLLYVEVNFDGKQGQDNPIIHGEDEKTDYATVEFPMSSPLHKASGSEEL